MESSKYFEIWAKIIQCVESLIRYDTNVVIQRDTVNASIIHIKKDSLVVASIMMPNANLYRLCVYPSNSLQYMDTVFLKPLYQLALNNITAPNTKIKYDLPTLITELENYKKEVL